MECEISQKGPLLRISDLLGFDHTYMRVILPYAPVPGQISATILVKARCVVVYESEEVYEHPLYMAELCWLIYYLWN